MSGIVRYSCCVTCFNLFEWECIPMPATETVTIRGIDLTTYLVKDAERAKKFYAETMGLKMTQDYGPSGGEFAFADGTTFGLYKLDDAAWHASGWALFNV